MKLDQFKVHLKIFSHLQKEHTTTTGDLTSQYAIPYQTVIGILNRWQAHGWVSRHPVQDLKLGGEKYYYTLTEQGLEYIRSLAAEIASIMPLESDTSSAQPPSPEPLSEEQGIPVDVLNGVIMEVPEYLQDIGVSLTEEQYRVFIEKLKKHLQGEGIRLDY
jgi:DNA-binding PadR family transcriptional regulator